MLMLRASGLFLIAMGIIWALQGAGLLDWPRGSFMLGRDVWMMRGLATAAVGAMLLGLAHYRQRR